ncbi:MAG: hypothetical protein IH620_01440 [Ignavibacterium sp.]|nr:hypothetical protein [Ignavibacterium sp.]
MINRIYKTEEAGKPVIHIIGKLDSAPILSEFLSEILNSSKNVNKNSLLGCRMVLDLKDTELISESCLEILKIYSTKCTVEFRNFSLYVELLLNEYSLLQKIID